MSAPYQLIGLTASPYSMKMRALMRYRQIPFEWIVEMPQLTGREVKVAPIILPVLRHPMGRDMIDSTKMAEVLEVEIVNRRGVIPPGDAAFLAALIEDLADEWLTKAMFWYRWSDPESIAFATGWLTADIGATLPEAMRDALPRNLRDRQMQRMAMIGATQENAPVVEQGYLDVLDALEPLAKRGRYLFGTRPGIADFALFGQLSQLAEDPGPGSILRERAPSVAHWLRRLDDLSGLELGTWSDEVDPAVIALLRLAGSHYLPFLHANEAVAAADGDRVEIDLPSGKLIQPPFRWQVRCLNRLRKRFAEAELSETTRTLLDDTGCLAQLK